MNVNDLPEICLKKVLDKGYQATIQTASLVFKKERAVISFSDFRPKQLVVNVYAEEEWNELPVGSFGQTVGWGPKIISSTQKIDIARDHAFIVDVLSQFVS